MTLYGVMILSHTLYADNDKINDFLVT